MLIRILWGSETSKAGPVAGRAGLYLDPTTHRWTRASETSDPHDLLLAFAREHEKRKVDRRNAVLDHLESGTLEFRAPGSDRHTVIVPDASEPGRWRYSEFDARGFGGHRTFGTRDEAAAAAADEGYHEPALGALDRLAATDEWARGTRATRVNQVSNELGFKGHGAARRALDEHFWRHGGSEEAYQRIMRPDVLAALRRGEVHRELAKALVDLDPLAAARVAIEVAKGEPIAGREGLALDPISHRWKRQVPRLQLDHHLSHLETSASDAHNAVTVHRIEVHPEHRNKGHARRAMRAITDWADENRTTLALSPDPAFGGNKARLTSWYASHGFVPNKGRAKDFRFQEAMVRPPAARRSPASGADVARAVPVLRIVWDAETPKAVSRGDDRTLDLFAPAAASASTVQAPPRPAPAVPPHVPGDASHGGHLHPEQRTDHAGHTQTRWVTSEEPPASSRTPLPAGESFDPARHVRLAVGAPAELRRHDVEDLFAELHDEDQVEAVRRYLHVHRPDLDDEVEGALERGALAGEASGKEQPTPTSLEPPLSPLEPSNDGELPAAAEGRQAVTPVPPDPSVGLHDIGAHIPESRREVWWATQGAVLRALMMGDDQLPLDEAEAKGVAKRVVTKKNLLGDVPSADELRSEGNSSGAAYLKRLLHESLGSAPPDTPKARREYTDIVRSLWLRTRDARSADEVRSALAGAWEAWSALEHPDPRSASKRDTDALMARIYSGLARQRRDELAVSHLEAVAGRRLATLVRAAVAVGKRTDGFTATRRELDHAHYGLDGVRKIVAPGQVKRADGTGTFHPSYHREPLPGEMFDFDARGYAVGPGSSRIERPLPVDAQDWSWAEKAREGAGKGEAAPEPRQRRVERLEPPDEPRDRRGPPTPGGAAPEMVTRFGIRGVQYGNYMTDADRAHHARQAYVALHDLGEVLGLPDELISYNGRLGAAFGARGTGQAAAHYEPSLQVINITRDNGGGSLAHEWGHFLDHMLGSFSEVDRTKSVMATDHVVTGPLAEDHSGRLRAALARLMIAMHTDGPDTKVRVGRRTTTVGEHLSGLDAEGLARWREAGKRAIGKSQFADHAGRLGPYWKRPHEMFARAFEAYVVDTLEGGGRVNSYLVGPSRTRSPRARDIETGEEIHAYPQGGERRRINQAFDEFFGELRGHGIITKALAGAERLPLSAAPAADSLLRIVWRAEAAKAAPVLGPPPARNRQRFPFQGTIDFQGLRIRVETPRGHVRSGTDSDGKPWSVVMPHHYGEFASTEGADGDPVDVFVGPNRHATHAYVVHLADPVSGEYDEDKVFLGFDTKEQALACFAAAYNRRDLKLGVRKLSISELREWLRDRERRGQRITAGQEMAKAHGVIRIVWVDESAKAVDRRDLVPSSVTRSDGVTQRYWRRVPQAGGGGGAPKLVTAEDIKAALGERYRDPTEARVEHDDATMAAARQILLRSVRPTDIAGLGGGGAGDTIEIDLGESDFGTQAVDIAINQAGQGQVRAWRQLTTDEGGALLVNVKIEAVPSNEGAGTMAVASGIANAAALGIERIFCPALRNRGDWGYMVWPTMGFVPVRGTPNPVAVAASASAHAGRELAALGHVEPPTLSQLLASAEGRAWWNEHGVSFDAVFNTDPAGVCMRVLRTYILGKRRT